MTKEILITLLSFVGSGLVTLIGFFIKTYKRNKQLKELCNYAFGTIDMIIQDEIKVTPEVRGAMKRVSKRYHKLDLVPEVKSKEKEE